MSSLLSRMEDLFGVRGERRSNCLRDAALLQSFANWFHSGDGAPSFAYLHLMSPHIPYDPPHPGHDFPNGDQVDLLQSEQALDPTRRTQLLALYDATVQHADSILGGVVESLDSTGSLNNAIVVVTADHGEEFFEHEAWGHGKSLYDELVNVPLVIAGYGVPPAVRDDPAMLVDVMPSLADILSFDQNPEWEGMSLLRPVPQREAYAELIREGGMSAYMIYRNGRKYIESTDVLGAPPLRQYFELDKDPGETQPLSPDSAQDLRQDLEKIRQNAESKKIDSSTTAIDHEAEDKLRALGYIN